MKKEDFELNKWYWVELRGTWRHYLKFSAIKEGKGLFKNKQYIADLKRFTTADSVDLKDVTDYRIVPISEIAHLLPSNHPDLKKQFTKLIIM